MSRIRTKQGKAPGCALNGAPTNETLAALVADYLDRYMGDHDGELEYYCNIPRTQLISDAVEARTPHGRHPHQRRLKQITLSTVSDAVWKRCGEIWHADSFVQVYTIVSECRVKGFGALSVYDAALRLGAVLGLAPDRVYLHSGTRKGAERLLGTFIKKWAMLDVRDLPTELQVLSPSHIENFLCIYKNQLAGKA